MPTAQFAHPTSGFHRQWLPRPTVALVLATLVAALVCLSEANAGSKRKSRKKAEPSSAQEASGDVSKAAESSDRAASDRKVRKASASKRGRIKQRAHRPLDEAVLRYLPENCHAFATLDVTTILESRFAQEVLANNPSTLDEIVGSFAPLGLEVEQIERITLGTPALIDDDISDFVAVLFCKRPPEKLSGFSAEGTPWTTERIGRTTLWVRGDKKDWAVCMIDDRVALAGNPDSLRVVLKRDAPAKLPEKLNRARQLTDPAAAFALSFLGDSFGAAAMSMGIPGLADGVEAVNLEVEFDTDLAIQWALICRDDESAQQINGMISGLWTLVKMQGLQNQDPAARQILRSVSFDVEGPVFRADMKVPSSLVQFSTTDAKPPTAAGCLPPLVTASATASSNAAPTSYPPSPYGAPASPPGVPPANPYANTPTVTLPDYTTNISNHAAPPGAVPSYNVVGATSQRPATPTLPALELADVVRLVEAGVDEEVIIRHVKKHHLAAPLSTDDLILLTKSKATTKVITALQEIPNAPKSKQPEKAQPQMPTYPQATPQGMYDPYYPPKAGTAYPTPAANPSPAATPAASGK